MKSARKGVFVLICTALTLSMVLSGCGASSGGKPASKPASSPASSPAQLKPYQLTFAYMNPGPPQKDMPLVEAAVNRITKAKINATVKLMPMSPPQMNQLPLQLQGGQKYDVIVTGDNNDFSSLVSEGLLTPLDDVLGKYGTGVTKAFTDNGLSDFMKVGTISGKRYAIPTIRGFAGADGVEFGANLAKKYDIDLSKIKSPNDLDAVFKTIKEKDPKVTPLEISAANPAAIGYLPLGAFDNLGDDIGVLMLNGNNTALKVVDLYETPYYAHVLQTVRRWWLAGYINANAATVNNMLGSQVIGAGKAFATLPPPVQPGFAASDSALAGTPMAVVQFGKPVADTGTVADTLLAIPRTSKDPARAMMFINLLYSDPQLVNLIDWGIAGKDYVKQSSTTAALPSGVNMHNDGYYMPFRQDVGNEFLSYAAAAQGENFWQTMKKWNNSAEKSPALGFMFDPSPVKTQYAAVINVIDQYVPQLQTGSVDPGKVLPEFIAKLKAAGIDQVIAAKQKQLDAWQQSQ